MNVPANIPKSISLLHRAPKTWEALDRENTLSHAEANALNRLVGAGMIQKRHRIRMICEGHPVAITIFFEFTGECGLKEALEPAIRGAYDLWRQEMESWVADGKSLQTCGHTGYLTEEWRITEAGEEHRAQVEAGNGESSREFIDSVGRFENRGWVAGEGRLISLEKSTRLETAQPSEVSLANWEEGAKQFAAMFAPLLASTTVKTSGAAAPSASVNARMLELLQKKPESKDWSAAQFADCLNLS